MSATGPNPTSAANRTPSAWLVAPEVQEAVHKYIADDPNRFRLAQRFGDFLTDHPVFSRYDEFRPVASDVAGDELQFQEITKLIRYHGLRPIDMDARELSILQGKLGSEWRSKLAVEYALEEDDFPG
jgi:hypothetical protein